MEFTHLKEYKRSKNLNFYNKNNSLGMAIAASLLCSKTDMFGIEQRFFVDDYDFFNKFRTCRFQILSLF